MGTDASAISTDYAAFHSRDTIVTPDNIVAAKIRYEATEAMANGTATPEQRALIEAADADMVRIFTEKHGRAPSQ